MNPYLKIIISAVGAALAIELDKYLKKIGLSRLSSLILACVISVTGVQLLHFATEIPICFKFTRSLLYPESSIEGVYIMDIQNLPERPVSIGHIEYNVFSSKYIYSGYGFDPNGEVRADWKANDLIIDLDKREVVYVYNSRIHDDISETIRGFGAIQFTGKCKGRYVLGHGFFVDTGATFVKSNYYLRRIEEEEIEALLGKKSVTDWKDYRAIVLAYLKKEI